MTGMVGGIDTKLTDGSLLIKSANDKNVSALFKTPFFVGTDQFG